MSSRAGSFVLRPFRASVAFFGLSAIFLSACAGSAPEEESNADEAELTGSWLPPKPWPATWTVSGVLEEEKTSCTLNGPAGGDGYCRMPAPCSSSTTKTRVTRTMRVDANGNVTTNRLGPGAACSGSPDWSNVSPELPFGADSKQLSKDPFWQCFDGDISYRSAFTARANKPVVVEECSADYRYVDRDGRNRRATGTTQQTFTADGPSVVKAEAVFAQGYGNGRVNGATSPGFRTQVSCNLDGNYYGSMVIDCKVEIPSFGVKKHVKRTVRNLMSSRLVSFKEVGGGSYPRFYFNLELLPTENAGPHRLYVQHIGYETSAQGDAFEVRALSPRDVWVDSINGPDWRFAPIQERRTLVTAGTWSDVATRGAPSARVPALTTWTGREVLVWGGDTALDHHLASGGRYDPSLDRWTPMSLVGAPELSRASTVWTGSKVLVWAGRKRDASINQTLYAYDVASDGWTANALPAGLLARDLSSLVWTGTELLIWGGRNGNGGVTEGYRYDLNTNTWRPMSTLGAPEGRFAHFAAWTGQEMLVYGGTSQGITGAKGGGLYDPRTDTWRAIPDASGQGNTQYVWAGDRLFSWGSESNVAVARVFDPRTGSWSKLTSPPASVGSPSATALAWTGQYVVVWSGSAGSQTGAFYDVARNTWTSLPIEAAPSGRSLAGATWTGSELFVWGGMRVYDRSTAYVKDGGRLKF